MTTIKFQRPHLLGLKIVESPLSIEERVTAVDPDISEQQHIASVGIVFGMVGIDRRSIVMDLHIVIGHCHPVLKPGIAICRDLNGFVTETPELGTKRPREAAEK